MKTYHLSKRLSIIIICIFFVTASCQKPEQPVINNITAEPTQPAVESENDEKAAAPTAASISLLPAQSIFSIDSKFCKTEDEDSAFSMSCDNDQLIIQQNNNRRKVDIQAEREFGLKFSGSFSIEASIFSEKAAESAKDENQYGFIITDGKGDKHVLRIQGSYFDWETWTRDGDANLIFRNNFSFS